MFFGLAAHAIQHVKGCDFDDAEDMVEELLGENDEG